MLVVFGSLNVDLVLEVPRIPRPGETVLGSRSVTKPGGKGANQAVAAARAGAVAAMVGAVGDDGFGDTLLTTLAGERVDTEGVRRVSEPTGLAMICVDTAGENSIAVAAGANAKARAAAIPTQYLEPGTSVLMQMEVPAVQNWAAIDRAHAVGATTILNLAPAQPIPGNALDRLDILVANAGEAETAAAALDLPDRSPTALAAALSRAHDLTCVVTLGGEGAIAVTGRGANGYRVGALPIAAVDTTGAGDTFTGVLAAALDIGAALPDALRRAGCAAALACEGLGAQEAMPTAAQIERALRRMPAVEPLPV